jgi:hypothetical protein
MSTPPPPISRSLPSPPTRLSSPPPPFSVLAILLPVSVSSKAEPMTFSIRISVSRPADQVFCSTSRNRLTVIAPVAEE